MGLGRRGSPKGPPTSGSPASEAPPSVTEEPLARSGVGCGPQAQPPCACRGQERVVEVAVRRSYPVYKTGSTGHTPGDGVTSPCLDRVPVWT